MLYNQILIPNQTYTKNLPSSTVSPWPNQQHMVLMFISPVSPRQVHTTNVLKIIEMILRYLGLWDIRNHDPPPSTQVYIPELIYDNSDTQYMGKFHCELFCLYEL